MKKHALATRAILVVFVPFLFGAGPSDPGTRRSEQHVTTSAVSPLVSSPSNDWCSDAIEIFEGETPYDATGATNDGPPLDYACYICDPGPCPLPLDIWFTYNAPDRGRVDINIPDAGFAFFNDVNVYEGCACPAEIERLLQCSGIGGVTFAAQANTCYLVQVVAPSGAGTMTLTTSFPSPCPVREPRYLYVDDDAEPGGDGASWARAVNDLQQAISLASQEDSEVTEIRVAAGSYKPDTEAPGDRSATFLLPNCVTVRGGYAGIVGLDDPDAWDPEAYVTTLTGDLGGDDGPDFANRTDNAFHVVTSEYADEHTVLEGVTVSGGNADIDPDRSGAGLLCTFSYPTIRHCVFEDNHAAQNGAGIYDCDGPIEHCTIRNNHGDRGGGLSGCDGRIESCDVLNNTARHGGGISQCDASILNSVISGNVVSGYGGGLDLCNGPIRGCLISGNTAIGGSGLDRCNGAIEYSRIVGNTASLYGGGFYRCDGPISGCVIAGNTTRVAGGGLSDCIGPVTNCSIISNRATSGSGGGAINDCTGGFTNCVFWNNSLPWSANTYPDPTYSVVQGLAIDISNVAGDPRLVDAGHFDESGEWIEGDYRLLSDSPCIDAGDNDAAAAAGLMHDLDGFVRRYDAPQAPDVGHGTVPIVDMGAYEYGDCNRNLIPDPEDVSSGTSDDCNDNQIPDECIYLEDDCNGNNRPDLCDINAGTPDCTGNGIPDECEPDCNNNDQADSCDILDGVAADCNDNQIPDSCDIASGYSRDELPPEGDGIPDECQADCNANGIPDRQELEEPGADCDQNGTLDACELTLGRGEARVLNPASASDRGDDRWVNLATDGQGNWVSLWAVTDDVVYQPGMTYGLVVSRSNDAGASWSEPVELWPIGDRFATNARLLSLGSQSFLAAWIVGDYTDDPSSPTDVRVALSDDAGATWSESRLVGAEQVDDKWALSVAASRTGTMIAAWSTGPGGGELSWYSRSVDKGVTWSEPTQFVEGGREREPVLASGADGVWMCIRSRWAGNLSPNSWDVVLSRSRNAGRTWTTEPFPGATGEGLQYEPDIATDDRGRWVAVWSANVLPNGTASDYEILVAYSADNGVTWSSPRVVNRDSESETSTDNAPHVWTDGSGQWVVAWQRQGTNYQGEMHFAVSSTNGASWSDAQLLADGGVYAADFAGDGHGTWLSAWTSRDDQGGLLGRDYDVFYAQLTRPGDCNQNGRLDACDLLLGSSDDCNGNDVPDECEPPTDCNRNGVQDICDAPLLGLPDCTGNGIPDECEADCDGNGIADSCDILSGRLEDCNGDGVPDGCDVLTGRSYDEWPAGGDGIPDECQGRYRFPNWRWPTLQALLYDAQDAATVLVEPGTYRGAGNRDLLIVGKSMHLECDGPPGSCILDCDHGGRGLDIQGPMNGTTIIDGFTIRNGVGEEDGGGARVYEASAHFLNCRFEDNVADDYFGGSGGGVQIYPKDGEAIFERCTFVNNRAVDGEGGGIRASDGMVTISECVFRGNEAPYGGGAWVARAPVNVRNSRFLGNKADLSYGYGGGFYGRELELDLRNSLFTGNSAARGNAIYYDSGPGTIRNTTFVGNPYEEDDHSHAVYVGEAQIDGCILWDNGVHPLQSLGVVSYSLVEHGWSASTVFSSDPVFVNEAEGDYRLSPMSPCIDTGRPSFVPGIGENDLDHHPRVLCGRVDIGAFEFGIGDYDCNRTVDLSDFAAWPQCETGPGGSNLDASCAAFDFNADGAIGLDDFAGWSNVVTESP